MMFAERGRWSWVQRLGWWEWVGENGRVIPVNDACIGPHGAGDGGRASLHQRLERGIETSPALISTLYSNDKQKAITSFMCLMKVYSTHQE